VVLRRRFFLRWYYATALGCRYCFKNLQLGPSSQRGKANEHFPASCRAGFGGSSQFANPSTSIDFKATSPEGIQRINQLWLVTYINEAGQETVAQAKLVTGEYAPLIAADAARLESMMPAARGPAKANNLKMRLIKLTNRIDIEDIVR
jgi:hypothetical protein